MGIHGGDIYRNRVKLDFSINVNPLGTPKEVKAALHEAAGACARYPDIAAEALKKAVGRSLGVPEEYLLFGSGASELFLAVIHGLKPKKTVIPVPSFYGYEYAAGAGDGEIVYYERPLQCFHGAAAGIPRTGEGSFLPGEDFFEWLPEDTDLVFLANPNNPDGGRMSREYLRSLLRRLGEKGITVVLDECFIEFCCGDASMLAEAGQSDNLILVRAYTKIYAIPGVRLGYLICSNASLLKAVGRQLPEWNLSCFAQAAGCACAAQTGFAEKTAEYVRTQREFLKDGLRKQGFFVFDGEAAFLLLYSEKPLYEKLLERGILIRDCKNFRGLSEGYYRIAVRNRDENAALLKAIGEINWTERTK